MKNSYKYTIPFYYTLKTRTLKINKKISYIFTYLFPVFILFFRASFDLKSLFAFFLSLIGTISIYEVGYLENDIKTVKKEINPTLRLKESETLDIESNFYKIIFIKYFISGLIVYILSFKFKISYFILGLFLIQIIYLFHNRIRNKINLISFFLLSTLRYLTPLLIRVNDINYNFFQILLYISLVRLLEKSSEEKYKIKFLSFVKNNLGIFRVLYYVLVIFIKFNLLGLYLLIYRIFTFALGLKEVKR
ncbi:MAG: hypothetical protein ACRC6E_03325 [Fusobacteriaceae bacterium]